VAEYDDGPRKKQARPKRREVECNTGCPYYDGENARDGASDSNASDPQSHYWLPPLHDDIANGQRTANPDVKRVTEVRSAFGLDCQSLKSGDYTHWTQATRGKGAESTGIHHQLHRISLSFFLLWRPEFHVGDLIEGQILNSVATFIVKSRIEDYVLP
jgi:hypothetical protein